MKILPSIYLYNPNWTHIAIDNYNFYVCGWAEHEDIILKENTFIEFISQNLHIAHESLVKFVSELNGNFSIIVSSNEHTFILSDRMRMFPIVYFITENKLVLTDNLNYLNKESLYSFKFNEIILEQYFFSDYVFGPYTVFKNVFSLQSGEIVSINHSDSKISRKQYFKWKPNMAEDEFDRNYQDEAQQQDEIFRSVFARMFRSAPHVHNWVVPLSGGYDSRTIVNYLYKLGIKNVICFTYGIENNLQSNISEQVAKALDYKWYFIDYDFWLKKIENTGLIDEFLLHVFNGTSVAHLQDFIAVYALKEMGILHCKDVFVPGHALEVLAGNHLDRRMRLCKDTKSVLPIIRKHFSNFGYSGRFRKNLSLHVESIINCYDVNPIQMAEWFDWQERQTKYIAYSVKVYEFFGYDWRIPEWDNELFTYWKSIGFNYRINRNMYKTIYKDFLSIDLLKNIPFANDILEQNKKRTKKSINDYLPIELKRIIKKIFYPKSRYYLNEGLHLVYSSQLETIGDYLNSFEVPYSVKKHLLKYPMRQKLSTLPINSVSTLFNIRSLSELNRL